MTDIPDSQLKIETVVLFGILLLYGMESVSYEDAMFSLLFFIAVKVSLAAHWYNKDRR